MQNWFRKNLFSYSNGRMISKSFRAIKFVFTFILAPSHYRYYCNYLLIKVIEFAGYYLPFTRRHLSYCFDRLIFQAKSPFPFRNLFLRFATTSAAFMTFSFFSLLFLASINWKTLWSQHDSLWTLYNLLKLFYR